MPFPRNYTNLNNEIERIKELFADRLDRPCLIVGNGPSATEPALTPEEIEQCVVFRANWFFLEDSPRYGRRVDGFFSSVENKGLIKHLEEIARNGTYSIAAYFQPYTSGTDDGERSDQPFALTPTYDHWALIASNPTLARYMMGRPLPTQGMQMIAFAAAVGFKDIRVSGVDMYVAAARRYAWDVPESARKFLQPKDVSPGYEDKHSLDLDLHFLRAVRSQYDFTLSGVSKMEVLAPFFDTIAPRSIPKPDNGVARPAANVAYVTLVQDDYLYGAYALARSLKAVSDVPLVAMYTQDHVGMRLQRLDNVIPKKVAPLTNPYNHGQSRFAATYTKLRAFELLEYDRIAFVDSDCVFLKNADAVFQTSGFMAAPDWGTRLNDSFNSGFFVFSPSEELRQRVMGAINSVDSDDGGDQGFLNNIFRNEWVRLPPEFNTLKRLLVHHPNLINLSDVIILHYVGRKPWKFGKLEPEYAVLNHIWARHLREEDWRDIFWSMRHDRAQANKGKQSLKTKLLRAGRAITPAPLVPVVKAALRRSGVL